MKLSKETLNILSNFSGINNSMVFYEGTEQRTVTPSQTLLAEVKFVEEFPRDFAIYDLSQFLGVISLFNDPELEFKEKYVEIVEGMNKAVYWYCNPELVKTVPKDKKITFPDAEVQFTLNKDLFVQTQKAAKYLQAGFIAFIGDGSQISLATHVPNDDTSSKVLFKVGETDKKFRTVINLDNIRVMDQDYTVKIAKNNLVRLFSDNGLQYTFAADKKESKFEG